MNTRSKGPPKSRFVETRLLVPTPSWGNLEQLHVQICERDPRWKERLYRDFLLYCLLTGAHALSERLKPPAPAPPLVGWAKWKVAARVLWRGR